MESSRPRARSESAFRKPEFGKRSQTLIESANPSSLRRYPDARNPQAPNKAPRPSKSRQDPAQVDDLGPDRQRRYELRALQRLGLVGQHREPAVHAAFPIFPDPLGTDREAAQIAQGKSEQPACPK